tara:strand:- start:1747 stop:1926 length:180 start_codon:yes stop_codon:yes gene_type:complete
MTKYVITVSKDVEVECEDDKALIHQASMKKLFTNRDGVFVFTDPSTLGWETKIKEIKDE